MRPWRDSAGTQIALVATGVLAVLLALAVAQLWGERRRLARALAVASSANELPGLPRGTPAPGFALDPIRGTARSLDDILLEERPAVLVFVSTDCAPCLQMLPALSRWQNTLSRSLTIVAVFTGERPEIDRLSREHELSLVLAAESNQMFRERPATGLTPSAVLVDPEGILDESPAEGLAAIENLIRVALARSAPARELVQGG